MHLERAMGFCLDSDTVSNQLANCCHEKPGNIQQRLYGRFEEGPSKPKRKIPAKISGDDIEKARQCGHWGPSKPSKTFLRIFHDVLSTIERDPMCGMVSPPLLGSCGVVPLTIIGPLLDICRHMSNCIVRAKKEVFLATNYWKHSEATKLITNSLKELSHRAGLRGERVVVKIMYDRGSPKQVLENHQIVPEEVFANGDVRLPPQSEVPNLDMEVMNFHRPIFGTFHSKFMVVDREMAIVSSNNIQENDNIEMMVRLEGPIVDSFYDMCCVSWHKQFKPPLPLLSEPASTRPPPSFAETNYQDIFDVEGRSCNFFAQGQQSLPSWAEKIQMNSNTGRSSESHITSSSVTGGNGIDALVGIGNSKHLEKHTADKPHYDPDIAHEVLRAQSSLAPSGEESRMQAVARHLNVTKEKSVEPSAPECNVDEEMTTFIPLPKHDLVPMAMVCRKPWGAPNHSSLDVPQNAAFIAALRYAKESVFIQTPNLNAEPLLPEIISALRRGVSVTYYVCLGYNDAGELLPYQNGTNEMVANRLYKQLDSTEKKLLNIFNYVSKDQIKPIHNKFKKRSCHIKLLIADGHIGIQGNGNQDTQSWFHSQEINVLIDSRMICASWEEGIRRNQNTHIYGAVNKDGPEAGCWHDENGKQADGAIGTDPGRFAWAKGIVGAVQRVRGAGGF